MTNYYWVIGTPRSGTSMVTDFIGKYTSHVFNEPFEKYPVRAVHSWKLPEGQSIVFKYCCNWMDADIIKTKFQKSKFIHIIRNPADVIYSLVSPKKDSKPYREFADLGALESKQRFKNAINYWKDFAIGSLGVGVKYPEDYLLLTYENLPNEIEKLKTFTNLPLKKQDLFYRCNNVSLSVLSKLEPMWNEYPDAIMLRKQILEQYYSTEFLSHEIKML